MNCFIVIISHILSCNSVCFAIFCLQIRHIGWRFTITNKLSKCKLLKDLDASFAIFIVKRSKIQLTSKGSSNKGSSQYIMPLQSKISRKSYYVFARFSYLTRQSLFIISSNILYSLSSSRLIPMCIRKSLPNLTATTG